MLLSQDKVSTILQALLRAQYEFDTHHGLLVTDIPDEIDTWKIDYSEANKLIHDAICILDTPSDNHNSGCP